MNVPDAAPTMACPLDGDVLITRVDGRPGRYQLSLFPAAAGIEATSAPVVWQLAHTFAAARGLRVWFTTDGVAFAPAYLQPGSRPGHARLTPGS